MKQRNTAKGSRNGNWKGGISRYKDHYKMKLMRKRKLEEVGHKCEKCGKEGNGEGVTITVFIHHIDKDIQNHEYENLELLCSTCMGLSNRGLRGPSKGRKEYCAAHKRRLEKAGKL